MIQIDSDVYTENPETWQCREGILVSGRFNPEAAVAAMRRVSERFSAVDHKGTEHDPEVEGWVYFDADGDLYTPNYVSDPEIQGEAVHLYVDCKGTIEEQMRARFLVILGEELANLDGVRVRST